MRLFVFIFFLLFTHLLFAQANSGKKTTSQHTDKNTAVWKFYHEHVNDHVEGKSIGTVSSGSLKNGTIIPYSGPNFQYFDTSSYLAGRAFTHQRVCRTLMDTYDFLHKQKNNRYFRIMECSNEHGGKMFPHRTHQNGMSVDLMTPLLKDGKPYYGLDDRGISHYALEFDNDGKWVDDPSVSIDFETVANHLLQLNKMAKTHGLKISKVIFKMELKDELYATESGKILKNSGIYITRNLTPLINRLHDDHYHVDFVRL